MSARPTLHEIAAMPFPASVEAMREHYNPHWGKDTGDNELRTYRVKVIYETRSDEIQVVEVEAFTEEEALDLAEDKVAEDFMTDDDEIVGSEVIGDPK